MFGCKINLFSKLIKFIYIVYTCSASFAFAQVIEENLPELEKIDVIEHLGNTIPFDLAFTDDKGKSVMLGDYFAKDKPVILMIGYYECPMLCNLVFNGLTQTVREMSLSPGEEYQLISVSINPNEDHQLAAAKKQNYITALDKPLADEGWAFLTGDSVISRALSESVGFKYYYDEDQKQYAHPAVLFILSETGMISRYIYGIEYPEKDLKFALMEASDGNIGTTLDRLILYCYQYDPNSNGYVVFAGNVMRIAGVVTVVVLALFVGQLLLRERRRKQRPIMNRL